MMYPIGTMLAGRTNVRAAARNCRNVRSPVWRTPPMCVSAVLTNAYTAPASRNWRTASGGRPVTPTGAIVAAIDVLMEEPQIIDRLWENTRFFKAGLKTLGFDTGMSESPITPVIAGDGALAMKLSDRLFEEGVFAQGIAFPTVARDRARVRTIVTATHTRHELQFALDVFAKVGRELGLR